MRVLSLALAIVVASSPALAETEPEDEEDAMFIAMPRRSIGINLLAHATRIAGHSESGFGPALDYSLGRGRWQYFGEAGFASSGMNAWTTGALDMKVTGRMVHGGLGVRWLARQFRGEAKTGGVEMYLLSRVGMERFYLEDGTRLSRPDVAAGFGLQARVYKRPRIGFRLEARLLFTPSDADVVSCRGRCMAEAGANTGFMGGMGFTW